jgi:quinol monooxygenase YgiN
MYVVTVKFQVKPEHVESFRPAILSNAASSLADEPGCFVFDVCESGAPESAGEFFLFEVYKDEAAFQHHRTTPHFAKFDAASAPWIADKKFVPYQLVSPPPSAKR